MCCTGGGGGAGAEEEEEAALASHFQSIVISLKVCICEDTDVRQCGGVKALQRAVGVPRPCSTFASLRVIMMMSFSRHA